MLLKNEYKLSNNENLYMYRHEYFDTVEQKHKIEYEIFNKNYLFNKSICEGDNKEINDNNQTISMSEFKNLISKNISSFINSSSVIKGKNFKAVILSSDDMNITNQLKNGMSAVDLGDCTEVLKNHYNIPKEENLIILNIESQKNKSNDDNNFNLGKNVQIEIYDYSGRQLNLSVCKNDIKIIMNLEGITELDIDTSMKYSEQGIDVFNINDSFFNDICYKYDNNDGMDIIIDDRRNDIYQNVTFCQDGCIYDGIDYDLLAANCICDSNIFQTDEINLTNDEKETVTFKTVTKSFISNLLDFNIEVIKCYNLVFDLEILSKNTGFYCMIILNILQIIFLCIFMIKKLKPIHNFLSKNLENKKENVYPPKKRNSINYKSDDKIIGTNLEHKIKNKKNKINKQKKDKSNLESFSQGQFIISKSNIIDNNMAHQYNPESIVKSLNINNDRKKQKNIFVNDEQENEYPKNNKEEMISNYKNSNEILIKIKVKNKKRTKKRKNKKSIINNLETINEKVEEKNQNEKNKNIINLSKMDYELDDMDYEEALIYDNRSYLKMYWSSLIDSQIILNTFFSDNNLNLFIIKLSFFIFSFEISFFLNTLFYTDEYISDAYHNNGVLDFVSGLPKSIYSFIATLLLTNLLKILSNSRSELLKIIREKSKDKEYFNLINAKLKKVKIKLIIYFILIFVLGLFFLYYVSSFCAVYRYSQKYWLYGCLESFAMDFATAFVTSLFVSFFKYIAIKKKIKCLFTLSNIIGTLL